MPGPIKLGKARPFAGTYTLDDNVTPASISETDVPLSVVTTNGAIENLERTMNAAGAVIGFTGLVRPSAPGPVEVQGTADADRGDGTTTLITIIGTTSCIEGDAVGGTVSLDGDDVA